MSKNCDCDSCAEGSITRTAFENMSEFRAAYCPCGKVENGAKLPSEKDQPKQYKLNYCLAVGTTGEGKKAVYHYGRKWETPSGKHQCRQKVTINAHYKTSTGHYAGKFAKVGKTSSEMWNHLNLKTQDWLHHKYID